MSVEPTTVVLACVAVLGFGLNGLGYIRSARKDEMDDLKEKLNDCEKNHIAMAASFDALRNENIHLMRLVLGLDPVSGQPAAPP